MNSWVAARRMATLGWIVLLGALLPAGCSGTVETSIPTSAVASVDQSVASRAVRGALGDGRTSSFFDEHPPVSAVVVPSASLTTGNVLVDINVAPTTDSPTEGACDIGGHDGVVTGVRWLMSPDGRKRLAVSPLWGTVSCLS